MKFRIFSKNEEKQNSKTPPNQLGRIVDVKGHLYIFGDLHIREIYPRAEPPIIVVEEDFVVEKCIDEGCRHLKIRG